MMNSIYIMWLRQIKRYWRSKSRIIGSIGQALLFLVALGFGLGPIFARAGRGSYINFLAPGVMSQSILFMAIFNGVELIWDRQFGFLKETLVAPVSRLEIVLGRVLGGATIAVFQGLIVFGLTLFLGFRPQNIFLLPLAHCSFLHHFRHVHRFFNEGLSWFSVNYELLSHAHFFSIRRFVSFGKCPSDIKISFWDKPVDLWCGWFKRSLSRNHPPWFDH
jgi:hypothetical protein